jgi:hypothetical protein
VVANAALFACLDADRSVSLGQMNGCSDGVQHPRAKCSHRQGPPIGFTIRCTRLAASDEVDLRYTGNGLQDCCGTSQSKPISRPFRRSLSSHISFHGNIVMMWWATLVLLLQYGSIAGAAPYHAGLVPYNLNENQTAVNPLDYAGERDKHQFFPSPDNWRFPFYTIFLDRFVNGDPSNDNIGATLFEHDTITNSNQMRHGGDVQGVIDSLDYLYGLGIRAS